MICCDLCDEWYHLRCMNIPEDEVHLYDEEKVENPKPFYCHQKKCIDKAKKAKDKKSKAFVEKYLKPKAKEVKQVPTPKVEPKAQINSGKPKAEKTPNHDKETSSAVPDKPKKAKKMGSGDT